MAQAPVGAHDIAERVAKRKRRRYVVVAMVVGIPLLTLLLVFVVTHGVGYWQAKALLDAQKERIRERNEPLCFADLAPDPGAGVHDDADRFMAACTRLTPLSEGFESLIDIEPRTPPGDYSEFRSALESNADVLQEIVAIARRSDCRFRYDYQIREPCGLLLPNVDELPPVRELLAADVLQSLGTGNDERAVSAAIASLELAELLRHDPFFVCQLVRCHYASRAIDLLQTILAGTRLSESQFRELDDTLKRMERRFRLASTVRAERASLLTTMSNLGSPEIGQFMEEQAELTPTGTEPVIPSARSKNSRWGGWLYRSRLMCEQAYMLETMGEYADLVDQPGPKAQREIDAMDQRLDRELEDLPINNAFLPAVSCLRTEGLRHRQRLIAARVGLRVDRFRDRHGRLPESLSQVLDGGLKEIPVGLFSGKALRYERSGGGFAIHDGRPDPENPEAFEVTYPEFRSEKKAAKDGS